MGKWYLLEVSNPKEAKKALVAARVPVSEMKIDQPRSIQGVAFPEEEKATVLEILHFSSTDFVEMETNREELVFLAVNKNLSTVTTVTVESWDGGNHRDKLIAVVKEVLGFLGEEIVISVPHRRTAVPAHDSKFHILIWSAPVGNATTCPPEEIFGVKVDCRDVGFLPSGEGIPIIDSATGWAVAELVDEYNLFIHHDLCHYGTDREVEIFRHLLQEVAKELSATPKEKAERQRSLAQAEQEKNCLAYVQECGRRLQATIAATRKSLEECEKSVRDAQQRITEAVRAEAGFRKKLEQLLSSKGEMEQRFAEEFDRLLQAPGVQRVSVRDGIISVFTDQIDIAYQGNVYDIGRFRVDIHTAGNNGGVRCYNLTRELNGYCHPHIKGDGRCCLGNIADGVAKLIGNYEFSVLAQVMLQYLRTVNPQDWYCNIKNWPVKQPAGGGGK